MLRKFAIAAASMAFTAIPGAAYEIVDRSGTDVDPAILEVALSDVADMFADPVAVQFRLIRMGKEDVLCGEVNAKNGYGAYTGFEPFYNPNISRPDPSPPVLGPSGRCK